MEDSLWVRLFDSCVFLFPLVLMEFDRLVGKKDWYVLVLFLLLEKVGSKLVEFALGQRFDLVGQSKWEMPDDLLVKMPDEISVVFLP